MSDLCGAITDWPEACGVPLPCALHPHVTVARVHPSNASQPQQSGTTFEAESEFEIIASTTADILNWLTDTGYGEYDEEAQANVGLFVKSAIDRAGRSRQVAPEVVESIAAAVNDRIFRVTGCGVETLADIGVLAVIREVIAQPGKAGEVKS